MWMWFGQKKSVRRLEGGRSFRRACPECGRAARFVECVSEEKLTVYSVLELASERETLFRCGECGELFRLTEDAGAAAPREDVGAAAREEAAERARAARERAARERADDQRTRAERDARVEAELAALKKKLGR